MSASASSSSSSPEPPVQAKKSKKKSTKSVVFEGEKNEGTNPNWAYKPPSGAQLVQYDGDVGHLDWDAVAGDDNLELWLVRVPEGVKPKHLQNLSFELPSSAKTTQIGSVTRKHATFDVWSIGADDTKGGEDLPAGGEEIKGIECLLPRKSKGGKLYRSAKPISRHIVISAKTVEPTLSSTPTAGPYRNPPRETYPRELLKHRFLPYGSLTPTDENDVEMVDVDIPTVTPSTKKRKEVPEGSSASVSKGSKRKGDGDTPKRSKKARISSDSN